MFPLNRLVLCPLVPIKNKWSSFLFFPFCFCLAGYLWMDIYRGEYPLSATGLLSLWIQSHTFSSPASMRSSPSNNSRGEWRTYVLDVTYCQMEEEKKIKKTIAWNRAKLEPSVLTSFPSPLLDRTLSITVTPAPAHPLCSPVFLLVHITWTSCSVLWDCTCKSASWSVGRLLLEAVTVKENCGCTCSPGGGVRRAPGY